MMLFRIRIQSYLQPAFYAWLALLLCSCSDKSYVEDTTGIDIDKELKEVVIINESFQDISVIVYAEVAGDIEDFIKKHNLKENPTNIDYIYHKFKTHKATSPKNIFYNSIKGSPYAKIYLDKGNERVWISVGEIINK